MIKKASARGARETQPIGKADGPLKLVKAPSPRLLSLFKKWERGGLLKVSTIRSREHKLKISLAHPNCIKIEVRPVDLKTNITTIYNSTNEAAKARGLKPLQPAPGGGGAALNLPNHKIISQYISRKQQTAPPPLIYLLLASARAPRALGCVSPAPQGVRW
uniref:Uncharacterized protein n=1 Tax=Morchella brunnea TaxID=1174671 RepID=A0A8K1I7G2_9PEZI|nr:hypothetical protein LK370_mgp006 [Morchella brunnea]UBU98472.1 hypothetical protein [Morchella brunnea]